MSPSFLRCYLNFKINNVDATFRIGCSRSKHKTNFNTTLKQRCVLTGMYIISILAELQTIIRAYVLWIMMAFCYSSYSTGLHLFVGLNRYLFIVHYSRLQRYFEWFNYMFATFNSFQKHLDIFYVSSKYNQLFNKSGNISQILIKASTYAYKYRFTKLPRFSKLSFFHYAPISADKHYSWYHFMGSAKRKTFSK